MEALSSILIVGHPHPDQVDFGADHAPSYDQALRALNHSYAVVVVAENLPFLPDSKIRSGLDFLRQVRRTREHAQTIYVNPNASARDIQLAINDAGIFKSLADFEINSLQTSVREALEEYELIQQNLALFKLTQEQNARLQHLTSLLEEKVKARQEFLMQTRERLLQATRRSEALHRTLVAIQRSLTRKDMEKALNDALAIALGLSWTRILFSSQSFHEEFQETHIEKQAILSVPLVRHGELIGHIYFGRDNRKPFDDNEQDFLLQVSDAVGLSIDRLLAIQAIERVKQEWDSTFDAITDPVSLISPDYKVIRANRSFATRANTVPEDVIGKHCYELLFGGNHPCEGCKLGENFSLGDVQTSDASYAHYDVSSHQVVLDKDERAFVLLYRDNSDVHRINRQILESSKMAELGTIGSSIAHEINNPLGGMIAFLQILKMEVPKSDPRYEDIHEMEQACLRCKTIVENLLAFTRQSGSGERSALKIGEALDIATNIMELQTRSMGIRVNKHIQDRNALVYVGKNEFVQVLVNILQNSCEAIAERIEQGTRVPPGEITIKTFLKGQDLGLEIIDNGTGIQQDQISKVFTPFFTTKNKTKNAGLGLSVSYQILKELNGSIEISSLGKQNTTVVIIVPLARQ